jgi:hypothetical protein
MMSCPNLRCSVDLTYVKEWFHDIFWSAVWIGNEVTGRFHEQFEVLCGLEQMIEDDVMT